MYTVSKGPSKIVAKTRRGISQNLERLETLRDLTRKPTESESIEETTNVSVPKPVFHNNSKRGGPPRSYQEELSPQHEEIIRFIHDSWNKVAASPDDIFEPRSSPEIKPVPVSPQPSSTLYYVDPPSPILQNFKPFDLESWWGRRLFHNITKSL